MSGESANVSVLINAFTQAAEESLDDVGDELNNLAADGEVAQAAMDEAADEMDDVTTSSEAADESMDSTAETTGRLAALFQLLQGRADEAADEIDDAGRSAGRTTGMFTALTAGTQGLNFSLGLLSTSLTGLLIPALAGLLATLVPIAAILGTVAAAAGGLAAAFGVVIGSGILAFGDQLAQQNQERLDQINEEIRAIEELRSARAGLTDEQASELSQARQTVRALESKRESTSALTRVQQRRLEALQETRDRLLETARSEGDLSAAQQARLETTRSQIQQIQSLQAEMGSLTDEEQRRLRNAQDTIQTLEAQKDQEGQLTETEQERLTSLEETRDSLEEQTSISGALAARMAELKQEIAPLIVAFGQEFVPLIRSAVDALPELVDRILESFGGLESFKEALRAAGSEAMTAIPDIVSALTGLARDALPTVIDLGRWLLKNGGDVFGSMVDTTRRLAPELNELVDSFIRALPHINDIGTVILDTVIPAISDFLNQIRALTSGDQGELQDAFNTSEDGAKALSEGIESFKEGVEALQPVFSSIIDDFQEHGVPAIGALVNIVGKLTKAMSKIPLPILKAGFAALFILIAALAGPITTLIAVVAAAAIVFQLLEDAFDAAMDGASRFKEYLRTQLIKWINKSILRLNDYLKTLDKLADATEKATGIDLPEFDTLDTVDLEAVQDGIDNADPPAPTGGTGRYGRPGGPQASSGDDSGDFQEVLATINVEGDNPLADWIRENAETEISNAEAKRRRALSRQNIGSGG